MLYEKNSYVKIQSIIIYANFFIIYADFESNYCLELKINR